VSDRLPGLHGLRYLLWGGLCLSAGVLMLATVMYGWVGHPGALPAKLLLIGAIVLDIAGVVFFIRYLTAVVRDWLRER